MIRKSCKTLLSMLIVFMVLLSMAVPAFAATSDSDGHVFISSGTREYRIGDEIVDAVYVPDNNVRADKEAYGLTIDQKISASIASVEHIQYLIKIPKHTMVRKCIANLIPQSIGTTFEVLKYLGTRGLAGMDTTLIMQIKLH